jgi:hypothetical protein
MEENMNPESAKEVAGKAIAKQGLFYITLIVLIGVGSSYFLDAAAITAVMTMVGGALVALINMLNGISNGTQKEEKPEFEVMKQLIDRLDRMADRDPMKVVVDGEKVIVTKGDNEITTTK